MPPPSFQLQQSISSRTWSVEIYLLDNLLLHLILLQTTTAAADENSQISFEEAVIAGRGTRQLPVVGPQQLMQQSSVAASAGGRGRGLHSLRRELPRPGNSTANTSMAFSMRHTRPSGDGIFPIYVDSEEEDWC